MKFHDSLQLMLLANWIIEGLRVNLSTSHSTVSILFEKYNSSNFRRYQSKHKCLLNETVDWGVWKIWKFTCCAERRFPKFYQIQHENFSWRERLQTSTFTLEQLNTFSSNLLGIASDESHCVQARLRSAPRTISVGWTGSAERAFRINSTTVVGMTFLFVPGRE